MVRPVQLRELAHIAPNIVICFPSTLQRFSKTYWANSIWTRQFSNRLLSFVFIFPSRRQKIQHLHGQTRTWMTSSLRVCSEKTLLLFVLLQDD